MNETTNIENPVYYTQLRKLLTTKSQIRRWLESHNIKNFTIEDDLTVNIGQDHNVLYISIRGDFEYFPINFNIVKGSLAIVNDNLKSLIGCPKTVEGDFIIKNNSLTSLVGGPETVEGKFDCSKNRLESLLGGPKTVWGGYFCNNNRLTSLLGSPKKIDGSFHCQNNFLLSLNDGPNEVAVSYFCYNNPSLTSLENLNLSVGTFNCEDTPITTLENSHLSIRDNFTHSAIRGKRGKLVLIEQYKDAYDDKHMLRLNSTQIMKAILDEKLSNKSNYTRKHKL